MKSFRLKINTVTKALAFLTISWKNTLLIPHQARSREITKNRQKCTPRKKKGPHWSSTRPAKPGARKLVARGGATRVVAYLYSERASPRRAKTDDYVTRRAAVVFLPRHELASAAAAAAAAALSARTSAEFKICNSRGRETVYSHGGAAERGLSAWCASGL